MKSWSDESDGDGIDPTEYRVNGCRTGVKNVWAAARTTEDMGVGGSASHDLLIATKASASSLIIELFNVLNNHSLM